MNDQEQSRTEPEAPVSNGDAELTADENSAGEPLAGLDDDFLQEMMSGNFIEYASYSIRERAIPHIDDGLKPVQRRILHSLYEKDDGRYHKVANIIGHTMQYHPHGDASIGDALIVLANKQYFIDPQGNFGNIFTGDEASAARYIECRLTPLAREVMFNPEITEFIDSYDGRNREPATLPAKAPSLLMLGAEGIAVGMRTRILPHNFGELLKAQIKLLQGRSANLYPDFPTGGTMDVNEYEDGYGKVKVRARIDIDNDKTLVIREIPYTTTTESLISSIEEAVRKNKIKISSIHDYTAEKVEIEINLPRGIYADETRQQLFAYTDCEINLSSQIIVIKDNRPLQTGVADLLRHSTSRLCEFLRRELEIELRKLHERFHERSLVRIFIEHRIYKQIEEAETYPEVLRQVHTGLAPFTRQLHREINDQDVEKLLQIQIRRISRFDLNKNRQELENIEAAIERVSASLSSLTEYAINYLRELLRKYGKNCPRQTRITDLQEVDAREVALRNIKVGHDRKNHFIGSAVRNSNKTEGPLLCSEFDRLVIMRGDGSFKVIAVPEKVYVGAVKYVFIADRQQVYSMLYRDRTSKRHYVKRFKIDRFIMGREYRTIPRGCLIESIHTNYGVILRGEFKNRKKDNEDYLELELDSVETRSTSARGFKVSDREISAFTQLRRGSPRLAEAAIEPPEPDSETNPGADNAPPAPGPSASTTPASPEETTDSQSEIPTKAKPRQANGSPPKNGQGQKSPPDRPGKKLGKPPSNGKTATPARQKENKDKPRHILIDEDTPFFLE